MRVENKKAIVISYGQGRKIEKISINLFEDDYFYDLCFGDARYETANNYCKVINDIELKDDSWVFARIIKVNNPYIISNFIPFKFSDIIVKLDDISIKKALNEINDINIILNAIITENDKIKSKILTNISNEKSEIIKEDLKRMSLIEVSDTKDAQKEILSIIRNLIECSEIKSPYMSEDDSIEISK